MNYDFTTLPQRQHTGSLKWERYAGRDIVPLWVADMDFLSPPEVIAALQERVSHGVFGYTLPTESLNQAVLNYLQESHQASLKKSHLVWLPGLVPALNTCCRAFCREGEEVMVCTPVYPPFLSAPLNQGARRIPIPLRENHAGTFSMDFDAMEAAITDQTRLFILCNPHNPLGLVFPPEDLTRLIRFCAKHNLILCSDEIHCDLVLDENLRHHSILSFGEEAACRSIVLMAPSKTFNLPGLACSFAVISNPELRARFERARQGMITEVNCLGYTGCEAAYRFGQPWLKALLEVLRQNRQITVDFFRRNLPQLPLIVPSATYLLWFDARPLNLHNPQAFFENHGVGLSNGLDFGADGWLRLNFACPAHLLQIGLQRLQQAVQNASFR